MYTAHIKNNLEFRLSVCTATHGNCTATHSPPLPSLGLLSLTAGLLAQPRFRHPLDYGCHVQVPYSPYCIPLDSLEP